MSKHNGIQILALDIETAPSLGYFWQAVTRFIPASQVARQGYTLCWAARWLHGKHTMFRSIHHHGKDEFIEKMWELLDEADAVLTYNGKRFDIKKLNAEFIKRGFPPPSPYKHIDLFETVKSQMDLVHSGLDPVARFLDLGQKIEHKGMALWTGCMDGNEADWRRMRAYNKQDVDLLIEVYYELLPWIRNHPNVALYMQDSGEVQRCTKCGSENIKKNGVEHTQVLTYQRFRCNDCGNPMKGRFAIAGRGNDNILRSA